MNGNNIGTIEVLSKEELQYWQNRLILLLKFFFAGYSSCYTNLIFLYQTGLIYKNQKTKNAIIGLRVQCLTKCNILPKVDSCLFM